MAVRPGTDRSNRGGRSGSGFTLAELLIVISIIVLVVALTVPMFSVITGSRSVDNARNQLSSILTIARHRAMLTQRVTGILLFMDPAMDRVKVSLVEATDPQLGDNSEQPYGSDGSVRAPEVYLDLVRGREAVALPSGVCCEMLYSFGGTGNFQERYLGFNQHKSQSMVAGTLNVGGVVLFDGRGQLVNKSYGFRIGYGVDNRASTALGRLLYSDDAAAGPSADPFRTKAVPRDFFMFPIMGGAQPVPMRSQSGLVLFNYEEFKSRGWTLLDPPFGVGQDQTNASKASPAAEAAEERWIDDNSIPLLVNRYRGTLIKGE